MSKKRYIKIKHVKYDPVIFLTDFVRSTLLPHMLYLFTDTVKKHVKHKLIHGTRSRWFCCAKRRELPYKNTTIVLLTHHHGYSWVVSYSLA